jgi:hypothetical protein
MATIASMARADKVRRSGGGCSIKAAILSIRRRRRRLRHIWPKRTSTRGLSIVIGPRLSSDAQAYDFSGCATCFVG